MTTRWLTALLIALLLPLRGWAMALAPVAPPTGTMSLPPCHGAAATVDAVHGAALAAHDRFLAAAPATPGGDAPEHGGGMPACIDCDLCQTAAAPPARRDGTLHGARDCPPAGGATGHPDALGALPERPPRG